jgi:hypothetical protein
MAELFEWMFYEVAWRQWANHRIYPLPWWCQQYFRAWQDDYDTGLFGSKEAAFASNAHYRYWHMIGVKDQVQESLIGQAGEIEPVYDNYATAFFVFDPQTRALHLPQFPVATGSARPLEQSNENGFLPIIHSVYRSPLGLSVTQEAHATVLGSRQRSVVLVHLAAQAATATPPAWLCFAVTSAGPTGFQRHDKAGRYTADKRITLLSYTSADQQLVEVNSQWGPIFAVAPDHSGLYGNEVGATDPDYYLTHSPYWDLAHTGALNGAKLATDQVAGLCTGVFAWEVPALPAGGRFSVDIYLPVDDYRGDDIAEFHAANPAQLAAGNRTFWTGKLTGEGLQAAFPPTVAHLNHLFRLCRANLLILADNGAIHPGPTIYDSFWVRDSSVEGIACALAGDLELPRTQFGTRYLTVFNRQSESWGSVNLKGFFGSDHEKNDQEWDSNGEALWAFGRMDRILGASENFGLSLYWPYILEGARWLRDNRSVFGLLNSGWSAEHIGDKGQPHYWDDLWGLAGLWEAAQLATRINAREVQELWDAYDSLRQATADSIRWVLTQQRRDHWETFVPTGPGDVGRLDSTLIGAVAYFHPCRLYVGARLGDDIDAAFRATLETIWSHFIDGGFRHDSAWYCYGPYLTLQLAHAFLLVGQVDRMDQLLAWSVGDAGYAKIARNSGWPGDFWEVALGAWNEQHNYPIAKDFAEVPNRWWYMGDIPHGWACAELILLLRDILFFEVAEDNDPHIYLAAGVMPHWLAGGGTIGVADAPTIFGGTLGFSLTHDAAAKKVTITLSATPPGNPWYIYPCRFGEVTSASSDAGAAQINGREVHLPAGTTAAAITYA